MITYEFSGKTGIGKPRFARYKRKRDDVPIETIEDTDNQKLNTVIDILKKIKLNESETFKEKPMVKRFNP